MPILSPRYDRVKIYRPNGTRYANGQTLRDPSEAVASALYAFMNEFGRPATERSTIEVLGVTGGWVATVLEIPEE